MLLRAFLTGFAFALIISAVPARAQGDAAVAAASSAPDSATPAPTVMTDRKARLARLFDSLATAETPEDAQRFEAAIDAIWNQSGSPTADLLTARAVNLVSTEDQAGALKLLDAALEARPDFAEGWNKRATLFFLRGDYVSAMSAIYQALRYEPRHYGAWAGLGKILQQSGDERKALEAYRRALAIHPNLDGLRKEVDELDVKLRGQTL